MKLIRHLAYHNNCSKLVKLSCTNPQTNTKTLGTVCADGEPTFGESRGSGPSRQAATLRPSTETDSDRSNGALLFLWVHCPHCLYLYKQHSIVSKLCKIVCFVFLDPVVKEQSHNNTDGNIVSSGNNAPRWEQVSYNSFIFSFNNILS